MELKEILLQQINNGKRELEILTKLISESAQDSETIRREIINIKKEPIEKNKELLTQKLHTFRDRHYMAGLFSGLYDRQALLFLNNLTLAKLCGIEVELDEEVTKILPMIEAKVKSPVVIDTIHDKVEFVNPKEFEYYKELYLNSI
ncbi:hypothetical protein EBU91_04815, partial [bacterium]|nr:hypothetical protein [bacterium]